MRDMDYEILAAHGVDWREGLRRCMNDKTFYRKYLRMFLQDGSFGRAQAAYDAGDNAALFEAAHELKGLCGNASLTALHAASAALCDALRGGAGGSAARAFFPAVADAYWLTRAGVEAATREE